APPTALYPLSLHDALPISVLASVLPTFLLLLDLPDVVDEFFLTSRFNQLVAYSVALVSTLMLFLVIYRIVPNARQTLADVWPGRSEEHTSELQSRENLVCR